MPPGYRVLLVYLQRCGYQIEHYHTSHYQSLRQICSVHFLHSEELFQCINIIVCEGSHALLTISCFHSTLVMNYISYYGVVCFYPMWMMLNFEFIVRYVILTCHSYVTVYIYPRNSHLKSLASYFGLQVSRHILMYIIASYFGLQLFSLSHKQVMGPGL